MAGQQVLQEEGEEVAVEVAVKDLEPGGSEGLLGGGPGQEQPSPPCPSTWSMPERNLTAIPVAYLILLIVRSNDKTVISTN